MVILPLLMNAQPVLKIKLIFHKVLSLSLTMVIWTPVFAKSNGHFNLALNQALNSLSMGSIDSCAVFSFLNFFSNSFSKKIIYLYHRLLVREQRTIHSFNIAINNHNRLLKVVFELVLIFVHVIDLRCYKCRQCFISVSSMKIKMS